MSGAKAAKKKQSFWETLRAASGSYRRLYGYVKPYKTRFIAGLALGLAYGGVNSLFPIAIARVTSTIFHGTAPNPMAVGSNLHALDTGPKINSIILICLAIPAIMMVRSLCSFGSTYCMQWVSNKVVSDIRSQLFSKMLRNSMDFFNKARSGFLMSVITNNTRVMQMALSTVGSDIFKQPITIVGAISCAPRDGLEVYPGHADSFSNVFAAASRLRSTRSKGSAKRAGRHGGDGGDDAGNIRRHSGDQVVRA